MSNQAEDLVTRIRRWWWSYTHRGEARLPLRIWLRYIFRG